MRRAAPRWRARCRAPTRDDRRLAVEYSHNRCVSLLWSGRKVIALRERFTPVMMTPKSCVYIAPGWPWASDDGGCGETPTRCRGSACRGCSRGARRSHPGVDDRARRGQAERAPADVLTHFVADAASCRCSRRRSSGYGVSPPARRVRRSREHHVLGVALGGLLEALLGCSAVSPRSLRSRLTRHRVAARTSFDVFLVRPLISAGASVRVGRLTGLRPVLLGVMSQFAFAGRGRGSWGPSAAARYCRARCCCRCPFPSPRLAQLGKRRLWWTWPPLT